MKSPLGILQRYTLREIVGPSVMGLLVFTFLLLVREVFRMMDLLINTSITIMETAEVIMCILPVLCTLTIPMALLLGVLLGLGRMSSENEILAIRTSGVHLWTIYWPIIAVCAAVSALMILANLSLTPSLAQRAEDVKLRIAFKLANAFEPGRVHAGFAEDSAHAAIYFRSRDPKTEDLRDVSMKLGNAEGSLNNGEVFISAPMGRIVPNEESATISFVLRDGDLHFRSHNPGRESEYDVASFSCLTRAMTLDIGNRSDEGTFKKSEKMMTVAELRRDIRDAQAGKTVKKSKSLCRERVELAKRFSVPLACVAVILLAIPLAVYIRPSAKTLGFAIALALTFAYYVLVQWGVKLGLAGSPLGGPVIFMPNLLLGGIGVVLMVRTIRQ